jgi:hypothetical protein
MAVYKVPQDVEADDKLIGPFSFRQFIYLIIVAIAGAVAYFLGRIFIGLAILPLPICIFFLVLALPLRKEQPMELYLAAMVRFFLKPKLRMWVPDGSTALVEVTAPKAVEELRTKGLSQDEARDRLSYLAQVMDSRGWATKGVSAPAATFSSAPDPLLTAAPSDAEDILDTTANISRTFDSMLAQKDAQMREETVQHMRDVAAQPAPPPTPMQQPPTAAIPSIMMPPGADDDANGPHYSPYPTMHQHIVPTLEEQQKEEQQDKKEMKKTKVPETAETAAVPQPPETVSEKEFDYSGLNQEDEEEGEPRAVTTAQPTETSPPQIPQTPMQEPISPDKINLAYNTDLSISAIAHEAHRIEDKHLDEGEVVIDLHKR